MYGLEILDAGIYLSISLRRGVGELQGGSVPRHGPSVDDRDIVNFSASLGFVVLLDKTSPGLLLLANIAPICVLSRFGLNSQH